MLWTSVLFPYVLFSEDSMLQVFRGQYALDQCALSLRLGERAALWQAPRTARSTRRFGVGTAQVTKNTCLTLFWRTHRANNLGPIAPKLCRS